MGVLTGMLHHNFAPETHIHNNNNHNNHNHSHNHSVERTKLMLHGFAFSALTGGLLFPTLAQSTPFLFLTSPAFHNHQWWSFLPPLLFFLLLVQATHTILTFLSSPSTNNNNDHRHTKRDHNNTRRSNNNNNHSSSSSSGSILRNRGRLGSYNRVRIHSTHSQSSADNNKSTTPTRARLYSQSSASSDKFFDCQSHGNDSFDEPFDPFFGNSATTTATTTTHAANDNDDADHHSLPPLHAEYKESLPSPPTSPLNDHHHETHNSNSSLTVFRNRRCVFPDGTPSPVPEGCCPYQPPHDYQTQHGTNALSKWNQTQKWRRQHKIYKILDTPHPWFLKIKQHASSTLHGYSKLGYPVVYEKPRDMHIKTLFRDGGLQVDDLLHHYAFFLEYMRHVICNKPMVRRTLDQRSGDEALSPWKFLIVWDMSDFSLTANASPSVLKYLNKADGLNAAHYPNSMMKGVAINTPFWFSGAFQAVRKVLPSNLKIDLFSSHNQLEGLRELIEDDQIPREFGGSSVYKLGEHPFETELFDLVRDLNDREEEDEEDEEDDEEEVVGDIDDVVVGFHDGIEIDYNCIPNGVSNEFSGDDPEPSEQPEAKDSSEYHHQETTVIDVETGQNGGHSPLHLRTSTTMTKPPERIDVRTTNRGILPTVSLQYNERNGDKKQTNESRTHHSEEYVFVLASIIHSLVRTILGFLETMVPLYLMSPPRFGGMGYGPSRAGISYFCTYVVVILLLRTKVSRLVFHIPEKSILRGFRIGVGAQAFFLVLLPFIPASAPENDEDNERLSTMAVVSLFAILSTLGALMFTAAMIGRNSASKLHVLATVSYVEKLSLHCDTRTSLGSLIDRVVAASRRGGLTYAVGATGEITGAIVAIPAYTASASDEGPLLPFGVSVAFFIASIACVALYIASFSFNLKPLEPREEDGGGRPQGRNSQRAVDDLSSPVTCSFSLFGEICAVSIGDVTSIVASTRGRQSVYDDEAFAFDSKTT